jgi:hypothetical protein
MEESRKNRVENKLEIRFDRKMRLRLVTTAFRASIDPTSAGEAEDFSIGEELVFLRYEAGNAVFAKAADIPEEQINAPQRLPEYFIDRETFGTSTMVPNLPY